MGVKAVESTYAESMQVGAQSRELVARMGLGNLHRRDDRLDAMEPLGCAACIREPFEDPMQDFAGGFSGEGRRQDRIEGLIGKEQAQGPGGELIGFSGTG